jgi:hypothetical protein
MRLGKGSSARSAAYWHVPIAMLLAARGLFCVGLALEPTQEGYLPAGETTWEISRGLDWANHQYTDIPVFNCNGSLALFHDQQGTFYLSNSLDSEPFKLGFDEPPTGKVEWDRKRPSILFYLSKRNATYFVHEFDVISSQDRVIHRTSSPISEIAPPHPDGEHLLMGTKEQSASIVEVLSLSSGKIRQFAIDKSLHRIRFTMADDLTVYLNSSDIEPKPSWLLDVDSGQLQQVYEGSSTSPTWRPGGEHFCFYGRTDEGKAKSLLVLDKSGAVIKSFPGLDNHHLNWSRDGNYIVTDVDVEKPGEYRGWICAIDFESGAIHRVVKHDSHVNDYLDEKYSPGHPHPQFSPDATKIIYNSTRYGMAHPQVFVSLFQRPSPPEDAVLAVEGNNVTIRWKPPHGVEIQRCLVYRVGFNGEALAAQVDLPLTSFAEPLQPAVSGYRVVFQEYCGLMGESAMVPIK